MRKKNNNYLLIVMNLIGIIADIILLVFANELAYTTKVVYGEAVNVYGNNIVGIFLVNIQIIGLIFYLGLALPNIISAIKNRNNKKLFFWQLIFGLIMLYIAISNFIPVDILYKFNYVLLICQFIAIFMQFIYTHKQGKVDVKNSIIEILIFYVIQPIIILGYTALIIYSVVSTKISANEWNIEIENVKQSIVELNCIDDKYCIPVIKDNKYGFIDENGEEVVNTEYDGVSYFSSILIDNKTYYFAFAIQNDNYYIISKENKKIQMEKTKILANVENLTKEMVDETKQTANNQPIGEIFSNFVYIITYMRGGIEMQNANSISERSTLELQELENKNYDENTSYYYNNENFSINITPLDSEDSNDYTLCDVEIRQINGNTYSSREKIYGLEEYKDAIEIYSDGYIGFKSEDDTIAGWYDNYGNKVSVNTGSLNIDDVKNNMMILEQSDNYNQQYYVYDLTGRLLLSTNRLIALENCYITYNSNNKPIVLNEDFKQISDEYDEIII